MKKLTLTLIASAALLFLGSGSQSQPTVTGKQLDVAWLSAASSTGFAAKALLTASAPPHYFLTLSTGARIQVAGRAYIHTTVGEHFADSSSN